MMAREGMELVDVVVSAIGKICSMEIAEKKIMENGKRARSNRLRNFALKCCGKEGDRKTNSD